MAVSNRKSGDLLSQGLRSIAARENKPILTLEGLIGAEPGVTRSSIEKWRQGSIVPDEKKIDYLARVSVRRRGLSQSWLRRFLTQARFPDTGDLIRELFPSGEPIEPPIHHNFPGRHCERFVGREIVGSLPACKMTRETSQKIVSFKRSVLVVDVVRWFSGRKRDTSKKKQHDDINEREEVVCQPGKSGMFPTNAIDFLRGERMS